MAITNDNRRILYCRIGWMKQYCGLDHDSISGAGSCNKDNIGYEAYNFFKSNGQFYGYAEPLGKSKEYVRPHIDRLGVEKKMKW